MQTYIYRYMFTFINILQILDSINLDGQNKYNNCTLQLFCTTIHMHTILINKLSAFRIQILIWESSYLHADAI